MEELVRTVKAKTLITFWTRLWARVALPIKKEVL